MTDSAFGINSIADRRYYHFVAVKGSGLTLPAYWRRLGEIGMIERPRIPVPVGSSCFTLEHRKFRHGTGYARSETARYLSDEGEGFAPFHYDLFAARMDLEMETYLLLGYPFALLAREIVVYLEGSGFLKKAEFQNVDLRKWLGSKNRPFREFEGLSSSVVGVEFVVIDDASLTKVRLGGHDPFEAEIYTGFLKDRFEGGVMLPDQCVLACEREVELQADAGPAPVGRILRSRLHLDRPGNFKFYMHMGCANATLLPYAIGQIHAAACLKKAPGNPLKRIEKDESE